MLNDTKTLLEVLQPLETKQEVSDLIENEFNRLYNQFESKGNTLSKEDFFIGKQIVDENDLEIFPYFRDLYFLYWGLKGVWKEIPKLDLFYYPELRNKFERISNSKK